MGTVQTDHGLGYNLDRGDLVGSQLHSSNLASSALSVLEAVFAMSEVLCFCPWV